jgi:crotonobetainyl-CoA:carnitine CoA-transferase CaiB-like acyl-CoA transferase
VNQRKQILDGIRILDMSIMTAGPCSTQLLGDLGADVIKIEQPGSGDHSRNLGFAKVAGINTQYLSQNRSKRSISLNLNTPAGREIFFRLVPTADVVVENFRPGTVNKLGVDYDSLRRVKPDIIYVSISAFGQTGPYSLLPANDPVVQAIGGLMAVTGEAGGGPVRVGTSAPDFGTCALVSTGIMAALIHRQRSGQGQKLELSLLETTIFSLVPMDGEFFATGKVPPRMGDARKECAPTGSFETADGKLLYLSICSEEAWARLCAALNCPGWKEDVRYQDNAARVKHRPALRDEIQACLRQQPLAYWNENLDYHHVRWAPVHSVMEALRDPQTEHNQILVDMQHPVAGKITLMGNPARFTKTPAQYRLPPPGLGEHTESVLREAGYTDEQIRQFRDSKVI